MMKVQMTSSGSFRTIKSEEVFAEIRTVIASARNRAENSQDHRTLICSNHRLLLAYPIHKSMPQIRRVLESSFFIETEADVVLHSSSNVPYNLIVARVVKALNVNSLVRGLCRRILL